jgi:hypothetical protein
MALTSLQLQSEIDALDLAIGTGARSVRFQDRVVEYNSPADMMKARTHLYNLMYPNAIRTTRVYTTKGL